MPTGSTPTLIFVSKLPTKFVGSELIPSLQAFETAVLLLGLKRFPASLVTVVSAIESLLEPQFPHLKRVRKDKQRRMLNDASMKYGWNFPEQDRDDMRIARNKFIHSGFIPADNPKSIEFLFKTAIPMIAHCFRDIHSFDLIESLAPLYSEHMKLAQLAFRQLREANLDHTHCADALVHLLELTLGEAFLKSTAVQAMQGGSFEWNIWKGAKEKKDAFVHRHGLSWDKPHFDCPICQEGESILCELDEDGLCEGKIRPIRLLCTHCDFSVGEFSKGSVLRGYERILCDVLLHNQIEGLRKEDIIDWLTGFGGDFAQAIATLRNN